MRIAFLIRSLNRGGAERQLVELARGLAARGHAVMVVLLYGGGALEPELAGTSVQVARLGKRGRWDIARTLRRLVHVLRDFRPDILHGYLPTANVLAATMKPFVRKTRVVFGIRAAKMELSHYDWLSRLQYVAEWAVRPAADLVIANSRRGANAYCIANGVDTDRFRWTGAGRKQMRERWDVRDDETLIGLVARFDPIKDHITFLDAIARFERPNVRFVCIGGPSDSAYEKRVREHANRLRPPNEVIWTGEELDMPSAYSALDFMTLVSVAEGFPNVVAEAMSCGVPCVVTDVGDAAAIVGDLGVVVRTRDPGAIAEAWNKLLERRWFPEDIRRRVVQAYSVTRLVDETEAVLLKLVASSARRRGPTAGSLRSERPLG